MGIWTGFIRVKIKTSGVVYFCVHGRGIFIAYRNTGISDSRLDDESGWLVSSLFSVEYSTDIGKQQTGHWPVTTVESVTKPCFCNI